MPRYIIKRNINYSNDISVFKLVENEVLHKMLRLFSQKLKISRHTNLYPHIKPIIKKVRFSAGQGSNITVQSFRYKII